MENKPSITIIFDPATLIPTTVFLNGQTDEETANLQEIADKMIEAIKEKCS